MNKKDVVLNTAPGNIVCGALTYTTTVTIDMSTSTDIQVSIGGILTVIVRTPTYGPLTFELTAEGK